MCVGSLACVFTICTDTGLPKETHWSNQCDMNACRILFPYGLMPDPFPPILLVDFADDVTVVPFQPRRAQ